MYLTISTILKLLEQTLNSFKQSLVGLTADILGVFAGLVIASHISLLTPVEWALLAYPSVLAVRGLTNGILCAKLSTSLHLGSINTSFLRNTEEFYVLIASLTFFNFLASIAASVTVCITGSILLGVELGDLLFIFLCVVNSMFISFLVTSPLSFFVASRTYLKGLDPDYIAYPVMSTLADIIVSLCYLVIVQLYIANSLIALTLIFFLTLGTSLAFLAKFSEYELFVNVIKESFMSFLVVSAISSLTGTALKGISDRVGTYKPLYVVYPAVIDAIGDVGSIVGSTYTTKLALGELYVDFKSFLKSIPVMLGSWFSSLLIFAVLPLVSATLTGYPYSEYFTLLKVLLTTNVMSVIPISTIAFLTAIIAYLRGLDPDSFVNPVESSLADAITSFALLLSLKSLSPKLLTL